MTRPAWRLSALVVLGTLLMQAAWILALPPFRGIDEFDHAYRASAVAHGQVKADAPTSAHRGTLVEASGELIRAATPVCESYRYTSHELCRPGQSVGGGLYTVASGAGRYNPIFYAAIGWPSLPFEGASALYAMRIAAAILCCLFIGIAAACLSLWQRTRWPTVSLIATLTPVTVYSTAVAAPNGIEMCSALAVWCALLGLTRESVSHHTQRTLLLAAIPAAVVLTTVRQLGPVWLVLIVATVILLAPGRIWSVIVSHRLLVGAGVSLTAISTAASLAWMFAAGQDQAPRSPGEFSNPVGNSLIRVPIWFLQGIAAFPTKSNAAPGIVYVAVGIVLIAAFTLALPRVSRRVRGVTLLTLSAGIAIPLAASIATFSNAGDFWQGRYGLPYTFGVLLLLGYGVDQAPIHHRLRGPLLATGWACLALGHVVSVTTVFVREQATSPLAGTSEWLEAPVAVIAGLMALGWVVWAVAVTNWTPADPDTRLVVRATPAETEELATQGA